MTAKATNVSAEKPAAPARKSSSSVPAKSAPKAQANAPVKAIAKAPVPAAKKPAAKVKPVVKVTVNATKKPEPIKPAKVKKPKMVRDSFTMPKPEFAVLDVLKLRAAKLSVPTKKTELIRAGIKTLAAMSDASFLAAVKAVPNLKTGRPAKG